MEGGVLNDVYMVPVLAATRKEAIENMLQKSNKFSLFIELTKLLSLDHSIVDSSNLKKVSAAIDALCNKYEDLDDLDDSICGQFITDYFDDLVLILSEHVHRSVFMVRQLNFETNEDELPVDADPYYD